MSSLDFNPESLLENERSFTALFSDAVRLSGSTLYFNENFTEDPIFNHLVFDNQVLSGEATSRSECERAIEQAEQASRPLHLPLTIFIEDFWRNSALAQSAAIDMGYRVIERMHILSKPITADRNNGSAGKCGDVKVFLTTDVGLWNSVFMESFSIPEVWGAELIKRLKQVVRDESALLVLATLGRSEAVGCTLLHAKPERLMGVYCVGTIHSARSRGSARAMMSASENIAREAGCARMGLQTLERDNVTAMYVDRLGYKVEFGRNLLSKG